MRARRWIEPQDFRDPWIAYRMLRILTGYALPGKAWEGWTIQGDRLIAPNGRWFDANSMEQIERVYALARLWRQDYERRHHRLVPFPRTRPRIWRSLKTAANSSQIGLNLFIDLFIALLQVAPNLIRLSNLRQLYMRYIQILNC